MIRASQASAVPPALPRVPSWALPDGPVANDADAAFYAGAALASLDGLVRSEPVWAGSWRQRQALKCAVAAVRLAGRSEEEAALRDAWYLRPAGGDPGPAGSILGAWRYLASRPPTIDAGGLALVAEWLGLRPDDRYEKLAETVEELAAGDKPAPLAAAAIASHVAAGRADAEPLAWWLADLILARKLRWPRPVPLLAAQLFSPAFRSGDGRGKRIRPGDAAFERAVCVALANGAGDGLRLALDIARRADRLAAVTPKLRAKGAGEAIRRLLDDDAVPGTLSTLNLSRFAARRLFERLQTFEAVRELSGRASFRLYGL
ncbi:DUF1403 family protein (plasmid) [Aminobacter sp. SR38]|jgi:hypothetical protein|uniref:DUF1403 family protein n=1 Tax=Aminobacter sp. SR38 TaxID=2774562 RepID=UPI001785BD79|nr:DUF1403 family protein [Aminobacter sp. SR38]QOF74813.1 DUF1403 family protein [Aminobacter sp. SR38]